MDAKHTPGTWMAGKPSSVVGWPVVATGGRLICDVSYVRYSGEFNAESAANARLISAAPDMLEALRGVTAALQARIEGEGGTEAERAELAAARAALAKATGQPASAGTEKET